MMTAQEHADKARRLVVVAIAPVYHPYSVDYCEERRDLVALAQVHATLAVYESMSANAGRPQ